MRIVITGATGVIGRETVPRLVADGHHVVGLHRRPQGAAWLHEVGAEARQTDLFDRWNMAAVLEDADAVVHLATAIPPLSTMAKPQSWAMNDRLRDRATATLVEAARRSRVPRVIVESISFNYADGGDRWLDEDAPLRPGFVATESAVTAERHVASFAADGGTGVALRFAQLYGPGAASSGLVEALRARKVPLVGAGDNFVSSVHVADAGAAVVASLGIPSGVYNVADDEPLRARERLELQAAALSAPRPRRVPAWLARSLVGDATHQLTVSQRVLNRRLRAVSGWTPSHASLREGWHSVVAEASLR